MASYRTKNLKKKRNLFWWLSTILWMGTAIFYISSALLNPPSTEQAESWLSLNFSEYAISLAVTALIALILAIVIKDRVRNTIWMACVVLSAILYKETGMYITFALWAIDEWILRAIYNSLKNKVIINKEIDLREDY